MPPGKIMIQSPFRVVRDPQHGFRRLDPLPQATQLSAFYQSAYYHEIRRGGRAPELRRFLEGGEAAERERAWLEATLWADVAHHLEHRAPGRRVLEVGCGTGELLSFLRGRGFQVQGIEPAAEAAALARSGRGLEVEARDLRGSLRAWRSQGLERRFDAVILMNVLEHVTDPAAVLRDAAELIEPGGVVCIQVPNDFTSLQEAGRARLDLPPWWIAAPDHVHYFDYTSLASLLGSQGLEVVAQQGDFPMELFLLAGRDYVRDPEQGERCHRERVAIEMGWPAASRRRFYAALAAAGLGRNCLVVARRSRGSARVDMDALCVEREGYRYVVLRHADIEALRRFRNAQLPVLRQEVPLLPEQQEHWYASEVRPTHASTTPAFLLVSILEEGRFIGYGGLTHIDWTQGRAEVSFLVDPSRAGDPVRYRQDFAAFLAFLQHWAFEELGLVRLFTETYAFRREHLSILEESGFALEGHLRGHIRDPRDPERRVDSLIHGCNAGGAR